MSELTSSSAILLAEMQQSNAKSPQDFRVRKKNSGQEYGTMLNMIHDTVDEEGRQMEAEMGGC